MSKFYCPNFYKNFNELEIEKAIKSEGFSPLKITNGPNYQYQLHHHQETKLLAILEGSMTIIIENKAYHCRAGDRIDIVGNTPHEATVGAEGCVFFWAERLLPL